MRLWSSFCSVCVVATTVSACATAASSVEPPAPSVSTSTAADPDVVPLLGELVRAWRGSGSAATVRGVVAEAARVGEVDNVVEGEGFVVAGAGPVLLVVRLNDVAACVDVDAGDGGGVVVGDPARLVGCGSQDLVAVAAFVRAVIAHEAAATVAIVDDDAGLERALLGLRRRATAVWTSGGLITSGVDRDVFDVVVVDAARFELTLTSADASRLVQGAGRALAHVSAPRWSPVVAERARVLDDRWFVSDDERLGALAAGPERASVVDGCVLRSIDVARAVIACRGVASDVEAAIDDVVAAVGDPAVRVLVTAKSSASSTSPRLPLYRALVSRVMGVSPRVVAVPALDVDEGPSVCALVRHRGLPCIATTPLLVHRVERQRRGHDDEAVFAAAVESAAAVVNDVVAFAPVSGATP